MLVLSRKEDESIRIGDDVTVTIRKIEGNRVLVAIGAPRAVKVLRSELVERQGSSVEGRRDHLAASLATREKGEEQRAKSKERGARSEEDGSRKRSPAAA